MKVHKVTLLIVDHDRLGGDGITDEIENVRFPNDCIHPSVMNIETVDIGEWYDGHPLNNTRTHKAEFERLFPSTGTAAKGEETYVLMWHVGYGHMESMQFKAEPDNIEEAAIGCFACTDQGEDALREYDSYEEYAEDHRSFKVVRAGDVTLDKARLNAAWKAAAK